MANSMRNDKVIAGWLLVVIVSTAKAATVHMDRHCGETIQVGSSGGELDSQFEFLYDNNVSCTVTIEADIGRQILITFNRIDIEGHPSGITCDGDYLQIFDGPSSMLSLIKTICGTYASNVVSAFNVITLQFKTDASSTSQGFFISYTSFTSSFLAPCGKGEFECDNNRCINASLKSNLYDNCGDNSDENIDFDDSFIGDTVNRVVGLAVGILVAIIVGCIVAVVLLCVCIGCLCYHCCCKQPSSTQFAYQVMSQSPQQQMAMQHTV